MKVSDFKDGDRVRFAGMNGKRSSNAPVILGTVRLRSNSYKPKKYVHVVWDDNSRLDDGGWLPRHLIKA